MGYIANFIVYTLAMVGVIVFALFVFKTTTSTGGVRQSKTLKVLDSMSLGPRKTLYVVSAGKEKFLIAGDVDKTALISRLESSEIDLAHITNSQGQEPILNVKQTFQDTMKNLSELNYMDRTIIGNRTKVGKMGTNAINTSVMRNLAERIKE